MTFCVGDIVPTLVSGEVEILEKFSPTNLTIRFLDTGYVKKGVRSGNLRSGKVKDPYRKSLYGIAFLGEGEFRQKTHPHLYQCWTNMFLRSYSQTVDNYKRRYYDRNSSVYEDWHCFQNFAKWCEQHYVKGFALDKDLRKLGNTVYCPDYCEFVPPQINSLLLVGHHNDRELPIGVCKEAGGYAAKLFKYNKQFRVGLFPDIETAWLAYKQHKEDYVKEVAEHYYRKGDISELIYNNLMTWEAVRYPL